MWKFSTAKLESRGKVMKGIVRHQTSARPADFGHNRIQKRKLKQRGGTASVRDKRTKEERDSFYGKKSHNNCQVRTLLAKMTVLQTRRLSLQSHGAHRRRREQLCSLGKLDRLRTVKTENNVPERWKDLVPSTINFSVECLLRGMVTGIVAPLYDVNGIAVCGPAADDE